MVYRDPTPINPNKDYEIDELAKFIREKMYGQDTREAMALALEKANEVAEWSREVGLQIIDGSFDEGALNTEIERKLNDLEKQYAPELNKVRLAAERGKQRDFFTFHERNSANSFPNHYSVLGDRHFVFNVGLAENESVDHEFKKNQRDDYIKWTTTHLNSVMESEETKENFSFDNVGNGALSGSGANYYATTIGTTITHSFFGTSILFNHYTDERGGVWEISIDGQVVKEVSTHNNAVPNEDLLFPNIARQLLADGLENKQHTLVLKFIGDDPNNPPSGGAGTSRGWIRINDGTAGTPGANRETFEYVSESVGRTEMIVDSNKVFAFRIKANRATYSDEWIPEHNNIGSMFLGKDGKQELYIDGVRISTSIKKSNIPFKEAKIIQKLDCTNPHDPTRLGVLLITTTITNKGISFSSKLTWERETEVKTGYVNMFTINPAFGSELISSMGGKYDLTINDGSMEDIEEEAPNAFVVLNQEKFPNHYMYMQNFSTEETLRLNEEGRRGQPNGEGLYFLQHRDASLQKLYPHTYSSYIARPGETYNFEGHYGFGKQPGVAEVLV